MRTMQNNWLHQNCRGPLLLRTSPGMWRYRLRKHTDAPPPPIKVITHPAPVTAMLKLTIHTTPGLCVCVCLFVCLSSALSVCVCEHMLSVNANMHARVVIYFSLFMSTQYASLCILCISPSLQQSLQLRSLLLYHTCTPPTTINWWLALFTLNLTLFIYLLLFLCLGWCYTAI